MLMECMTIFQKHANDEVDKMILDHYTPAEGFYLILEETKDGFMERKHYEVKQDKKTKSLNLSMEEQREISELDYYCKLIDMNKAVDHKKIIQSNNFLSFWIKKESLTNGKLTEQIIEHYYEVLCNPNKKYAKSKKDYELYQLVEKEIGSVNKEKLEKIKLWVKENINQLPYEIVGKDYLKLFFICEGVNFQTEGKRYILPNIYNKNDYNIMIGDMIYGLPNENMALDSKKPYLENKNRKYKVPTLINLDNIILRKKFFDYLWGQASQGNYNLYFDAEKNKIILLQPKESPNQSMTGYYLRIRKDKNEAAILDMDRINAYHPNLKTPFFLQNVLALETKKLEGHRYGKSYYLTEVRDMINSEIFSNFLLNNLFNEPSEVFCHNNEKLRENILLARNALFQWFYKGYDSGVSSVLEKVSFQIIKNSISNGYMEKVQHQFNVYISMMEYFKGGLENMADVMKEIREKFREKINSKEYLSIESDEEYYYAVGQLINYFISLNKSNKKMHSLFNPFLTIKKDELLKVKLEGLFVKYGYAIKNSSFRFNNIYAMVTSYLPEGNSKNNYMIAGYISKNLIYEKKGDMDNE